MGKVVLGLEYELFSEGFNALDEIDRCLDDTEMYTSLRFISNMFSECFKALDIMQESLIENKEKHIFIMEADSETGEGKKTGVIERIINGIKTIISKIWEWLKKVVKMVADFITKPFKWVLGMGKKEDKKEDEASSAVSSDSSKDGNKDGNKDNNKKKDEKKGSPAPKGVLSQLSTFHDMKVMKDTGIKNLFDIQGIFRTLINEAYSKNIEYQVNNSGNKKSVRNNRIDMEKSAVGEGDSQLNKDTGNVNSGFKSLSEAYESILKNIVKFGADINDILDVDTFDSKLKKEKDYDTMLKEIEEGIANLKTNSVIKNFEAYLKSSAMKYIHVLQDYANDKASIVSNVKFEYDETLLEKNVAQLSNMKNAITAIPSSKRAKILASNAILESIERDPVLSKNSKLKSAAERIVKMSYDNEMSPASLRDYRDTVRNIIGMINSTKNDKNNLTMKSKGNGNFSTDRTDIFRCINYSIHVEEVTLNELIGNVNSIISAIKGGGKDISAIAKKILDEGNDDIKEALNGYKTYLGKISKYIEHLNGDTYDNAYGNEGKLTTSEKDGINVNADYKKSKNDSKYMKDNSDKSKEEKNRIIDATVIEITKELLGEFKSDVSNIINQVIDIEKHTRLVRQSRINALLSIHLVYFTNVLFTENIYMSSLQAMAEESDDEGVKKKFDKLKEDRITAFKNMQNKLSFDGRGTLSL